MALRRGTLLLRVEKLENFVSEVISDPRNLLQFLLGGRANSLDGSKGLHQRLFALWPEAGDVVENRLPDLFGSEFRIEGVRESVGLVTHSLKKANCGVMERESHWGPFGGEDDCFLLFRQSDERRRGEVKYEKRPQCRCYLAFTPINYD